MSQYDQDSLEFRKPCESFSVLRKKCRGTHGTQVFFVFQILTVLHVQYVPNDLVALGSQDQGNWSTKAWCVTESRLKFEDAVDRIHVQAVAGHYRKWSLPYYCIMNSPLKIGVIECYLEQPQETIGM